MALLSTTPLIDDPSSDRFEFGTQAIAALAPTPITTFKAPSGTLSKGIGSQGNDQIAMDGPGAVFMMGRSGDDRLTTPTNGLVKDLVYGDNSVTNPSKMGKGNDILDLGPNDHGKSGFGNDLYWIHGPGFAFAPTELWINIAKDHLIMSGKVAVKSATYAAVNHKTKMALLDDVLLVGDSPNPITDNQHVLMHLDSRREPDMPHVWVPFDGANPGLDDAIDWWATVDQDVLL